MKVTARATPAHVSSAVADASFRTPTKTAGHRPYALRSPPSLAARGRTVMVDLLAAAGPPSPPTESLAKLGIGPTKAVGGGNPQEGTEAAARRLLRRAVRPAPPAVLPWRPAPADRPQDENDEAAARRLLRRAAAPLIPDLSGL
ncbi:hypothetical protein ACHAXT_002905 [Thalassiosira profunda]